MSSRERVLKTLNHEEPDRVPLDMGSTIMSGIMAHALDGLRKHLGLESRPGGNTAAGNGQGPAPGLLGHGGSAPGRENPGFSLPVGHGSSLCKEPFRRTDRDGAGYPQSRAELGGRYPTED